MVTVEQMYKDFGVLAEAKDKAGEHEQEYLNFINAVKGGPGEKRLASQFIARFFKHFPSLANQAINALFDLCEDDDVMIRKQAIKDLPTLCKNSADNVPKIAEALTQLLGCDDTTELSLIQSSLINLMAVCCKGTLQGMFKQILSEDELVRERAIKFLGTKVKVLGEDTIDKEAEEFLVSQCKQVLQDVTKEEFILIMDVLRSQSSMSTVQGRQQLVEIVTEQADLDQSFEAEDTDCVDRLIHCIKQAAPLFSKNVHSKAFVGYICDNVLPVISKLASPDDGVDAQLEMLKLFSEISEFAGDLDKLENRLDNLYKCLISYMPVPPAEENDNLSSSEEEPKFQFSTVECLMLAFHQLGRKLPGFLADEANADRLKDFKLRLQYFARGVQIYIKQLRQALQGKAGEALKTDENKIKVVALKITSNINSLIKDLFHNPPSYKTPIIPSWKPLVKKAPEPKAAETGQKRSTSLDSNGSSAKKYSRKDVTLYSPPGGKFSERAGTYEAGQGRGRGRGRGRGFRGRRY
ncbi:apoptosis inhibitor 5-like [Mytilus trossulus]|uniref:apoptosis inhibitor 5-like n=1 Tax=Mytilus trossulus TaxID=6551 RepID=UPI003003CE3C